MAQNPTDLTIWSPRSSTILNGPIKIATPPSSTSKNNIDVDWKILNTSSANPAVKNLEYKVERGIVQFRYPTTSDPNGPKTVANSIQEIADDSLYVANYGYTSGTTELIKDALQRNLTQQANDIGWVPPPPPPGGGGSGGGTDDDSLTQVSGLAPINNVKPRERGTLIYPLGIDKNGQDYMKFRGINYIPQAPGSSSYVLERPIEQTKTIEPIVTIILPIQPTIMDTNTVSWGEEKFGILEMIGSGISLDAMNGATIDQMINKFEQTVTTNGGIPAEIVAGIKASLAQKAVGSNNNLLSRLTGAVTNPNLTLLFNSPDLRNFSFNFKLSPRSKKEGTVVRQIIRSFKELMAVQRTAGNLFLEAPCVFEVEYIRGRDKLNEVDGLIHPSLNRIKTCALRSFSVNYTPSGSYMAYNDKEGTMTSYDLTMSFTELDPIYFDDYSDPETGTDKIPFDQIGY